MRGATAVALVLVAPVLLTSCDAGSSEPGSQAAATESTSESTSESDR